MVMEVEGVNTGQEEHSCHQRKAQMAEWEQQGYSRREQWRMWLEREGIIWVKIGGMMFHVEKFLEAVEQVENEKKVPNGAASLEVN
jgi:hypothetical protein